MVTLASAACAVLVGSTLGAQCEPQWQPAFGHLGTDGAVVAARYWDADGAGPAPRLAVFGGVFSRMGRVDCPGVALFDPLTRVITPLPSGTVDRVHSLATVAGGAVFVGGSRAAAGGGATEVVARWHGGAWTQLGGAFDGPVLALLPLANGDLVAGGEFTLAGGAAAARVARWNGTAWSALGGGVSAPPASPPARVAALALGASGEVLVGGTFATAGATPAANVAAWTGSAWTALGAGIPAAVTSLAAFGSGDVFAASSLGAPQRWDGVAWAPVAGLLAPAGAAPLTVAKVVAFVDPWSGPSLAAIGRFRVANAGENMAVWTPAGGWLPFYGGPRVPPAPAPLQLDGDVAGTSDAVVAGSFDRFGWVDCGGAVVVDTFLGFVPPGDGFGQPVLAAAALPDGSPVLGGAFGNLGAMAAGGVVREDGSVWYPLGGGVAAPIAPVGPPVVRALAVDRAGAVVVGGVFTTAGGLSANNIARFDGASWAGFGAGMPMVGEVLAVLPRPNGVLYAGGGGGLARWDGASWTVLTGVGSVFGQVRALAAATGGIAIGGDLQQLNGARPGVLVWNGSAFAPLGAGLPAAVQATGVQVDALAARADGALLAAGRTLPFAARFCAVWNGAAWQVLPPPAGDVTCALALPGGDFVVGGEFASAGAVPCANVARWDGQAWAPFGTGVRRANGQPARVETLAWSERGEVLVGGAFDRAGDELAVNFARLRATCAAAAVPFGLGCVGSGGRAELAATALPWLGATARSTARGLPANGLALEVLGAATAPLPLASVLPAGASCWVWVAPDVLRVAVPTGGTAELALAIPAAPALVGAVLLQQVVALDLAGPLAATSSNRLALTLGVY